MNGPDYYTYPIFLLYWIVLKSKYSSFEEWKEAVGVGSNHNNQAPIQFAIDFIEKYGCQ